MEDEKVEHQESISDTRSRPASTDVGERIAEIDRELAVFSYQAATPEERSRIEERRQAEEQAEQNEVAAEVSVLGEGAQTFVIEKLAAEAFERAQKDNERFDALHAERQRLENVGIAQQLVAAVEGYGVTIPDRDRLMSVLTSNELIDIDRRDLMNLLGADQAPPEVYKRMAGDKVLVGKLEKLQQGALTSAEYREVLQADDLAFADWRKYGELEGDDNVGDPTDEEMVRLGTEGLKQSVRDILADPHCQAGQGMFWNVLISERSRFVLKAERQMKTSDLTGYQRRALFRYPAVRDAVGERFLPRQAVLASEENERLYVLQEKLDLDKMVPLTTLNVDDFLEGRFAPEIKAALDDEANRRELADFIAGVERLRDDRKLLIDPIGKNVFFKLDEGRLSIKLADYGCFELKWDEGEENAAVSKDRARTEDYIAKLKKLSQPSI